MQQVTRADLQKLTERELHDCIIDASKKLGWDARFTWKSLHSPKGTLDLMLLPLRAGGRTLFRELKGYQKKGKRLVLGGLTPDQERTILLHRQAGDDAGLWTPEMWFDGTIHREMTY